MTNEQKSEFTLLYKIMLDGPEHREIRRKDQSLIASDDEFHGLVISLVTNK